MMTDLPQEAPAVSPLVIAGLLLAALEPLRQHGLARPTADAILVALGVSRTQAYLYRQRIQEVLPELIRPAGRPRVPAPAPLATAEPVEVTREVFRFVMAHPGCASTGAGRNYYSEIFRAFVLGLRDRYPALGRSAFAESAGVPLGTLEDWLRQPLSASPATPVVPQDPAVTIPQLESLIDAWRTWAGTFLEFCEHAREHLRIPHGRTYIASILQGAGARVPKQRGGRGPDEEALRGAFEAFFPGAQWVGDGTQLKLQINDQVFTFNLELMVDPASGARTGASLRDEEDGAAVVEAFKDGVETTGAAPIAVLLDNRPSNHTEEVTEGLGEALRIRASPGRGQNKAHVEGSFGLFQQVAPELLIRASSMKELARQVLFMLVTIWGRATNHLPRADRRGKSRVKLYAESKPTPEQVAQAKAALRERQQKQALIEQRQRARTDPLTRQILDAAFERLDLVDPDGHFRNAIARYPLDDILAGIAIFEGKRATQRLPDGVDARYLLGIVRNVSQDREGSAIGDALLRARLEARDLALAPLKNELAAILLEPRTSIDNLVAKLVASVRFIDRAFWLDALAQEVRSHPAEQQPGLLRRAAREIHAAYSWHLGERRRAVRTLQEKAIPLTTAA